MEHLDGDKPSGDNHHIGQEYRELDMRLEGEYVLCWFINCTVRLNHIKAPWGLFDCRFDGGLMVAETQDDADRMAAVLAGAGMAEGFSTAPNNDEND